ncbi:thiamine biosynthesis protein ThiH [Candidatus Magnetomorum sp. HK-1]|nr:thiamine biosynthesis protein ThiH [Candidatus Magnetomorum sp. HK-1]
MCFFNEYEKYEDLDILTSIASVNEISVQRAINKNRLTIEDFAALISPVAIPYLEQMAQRAHDIKRQYFGNTIQLFTPMYLSNYCNNNCLYCGFNHDSKILRYQMTYEEVEKEAREIAKTGLKHILILTGDAPSKASESYLETCCQILKRYFSSISIEIYALDTEGYQKLIQAGVDGLTLYQETYNKSLYQKLHPKGPKKDFQFRLNAPQRGAIAGMRNVNIGTLLGLDHWQQDIFFTALHARWLEDKFPETDISISLPRMRPYDGCYQPKCTVSDRDMVQMITAIRIFLNRCGITISTRENESFRNNTMKLGVTKISAGSTTAVGGHTLSENQNKQFEISDKRSVDEMVHYLEKNQIQPLFKDWERF